MYHLVLSTAVASLAAFAACQTTSATVSSARPTPSVAAGYAASLVADGLETPRGIIFDTEDNLLTVQRGVGVVALILSQGSGDGSVSVSDTRTVVADDTLNHGIEISEDGQTLYASNTDSVFSWPYDASSQSTTADSTTLITNMTTEDHTTRTLLLSRAMPGMILVSRGSTSNIDVEAQDIDSGHSQIKAFNLDNMTDVYDFNRDGLLLGWGLRNDVGMAEEPTTGGLYSVENGVDQMVRMGVDVHAENPGEELNYLGTLKDNTSPNQGSNFGYPECYSVWDLEALPSNSELSVGMQFAIGDQNDTVNDQFCQQQRTAPRLVFEAHMAPLDIKFNGNGSTAWVSFHGSWNRSPLEPSGYKVSAIPFSDGEPTANSTSNTGYVDIVANQDNANCPDDCFRPVGLAFDSQGRLFFSSDSTGEIWMITQQAATNGSVDGATPTITSMPSETSTPPNSAMQQARGLAYVWMAAVAVAMLLI